MFRCALSFLLLTTVCLAATLQAATGKDRDGATAHPGDLSTATVDPGPTPNPSLSAADVVRIQMTALQQNGLTDAGIRTTFRFASPDNKQATGPYPRFALMIKASPYRAMLNAKKIEYGKLILVDAEAAQEVRVQGVHGEDVTYVFFLRRQISKPYEGCWMTEAVVVKPANENDGVGPPGVASLSLAPAGPNPVRTTGSGNHLSTWNMGPPLRDSSSPGLVSRSDSVSRSVEPQSSSVAVSYG